jgi:uncharacterized protein
VSNVPVHVWQLVRDEEGHDVLLLRDEVGRVLPIAIGTCEAAAIWVRLMPEQAAPYLRRPWTHDLAQAILERLGARLTGVVIDDLAHGTFFATLQVRYGERELVLDCRLSDAVAVLLRADAPLFVADAVMQHAALTPVDEADDEEPGFLNNDAPDEGRPG